MFNRKLRRALEQPRRRRCGYATGAPAQRVVHNGSGSGKATPSIQLVYARHGALKTRMGGKRFTVRPGEFVLLDNTRFYQMEMDTAHEAVDLMMPLGWLDRYLPDPGALLGRPVSAREGWGAPLGSLLETRTKGSTDPCPGVTPSSRHGCGSPTVPEPAPKPAPRALAADPSRIETDFADRLVAGEAGGRAAFPSATCSSFWPAGHQLRPGADRAPLDGRATAQRSARCRRPWAR